MERLLSMRNSNTNLISVVFILLVVNLIVFGAWFYVREKSLLKDGSDKDEQFSLIRNEKYLIEYISNIYNDNKVTCLSVLTEENFFLGSLKHIDQIKQTTHVSDMLHENDDNKIIE